MRSDSDIVTIVPNAFSRLKPIKKFQVEWVSLHMDHQANSIEVVFPSHVLFGYRLAMQQLFSELQATWPEMPWKCFPLWSALHAKQFTGLILLESPSKFVHDVDSWNARLDPKADSALYKTFLAKYEHQFNMFGEAHSLGLNPETASNLEIILKYGSIKEMHTNLHHVRSSIQ